MMNWNSTYVLLLLLANIGEGGGNLSELQTALDRMMREEEEDDGPLAKNQPEPEPVTGP